MDGNTALGASSPANPALHMPEPLSTTKAVTSSSHMLSVVLYLADEVHKSVLLQPEVLSDGRVRVQPTFTLVVILLLGNCVYFTRLMPIYGNQPAIYGNRHEETLVTGSTL